MLLLFSCLQKGLAVAESMYIDRWREEIPWIWKSFRLKQKRETMRFLGCDLVGRQNLCKPFFGCRLLSESASSYRLWAGVSGFNILLPGRFWRRCWRQKRNNGSCDNFCGRNINIIFRPLSCHLMILWWKKTGLTESMWRKFEFYFRVRKTEIFRLMILDLWRNRTNIVLVSAKMECNET